MLVHINVHADTSVECKTNGVKDVADRVDQLNGALLKYEQNEVPHVPWLDTLAFAEIDRVKKRELIRSKNVYLTI